MKPRRLSATATLLITLVISLSLGAGGVARTAIAAQGPPPTPVPPHGSPSPFPQSLDTAKNERVAPKLRARAALIGDLDTGQVLYAIRPTLRRPIASVTKIMTALLTLEENDLADTVVVSEAATRTSGVPGLSTLPLEPGERLTVEDLLEALLIQSANDAAVALAEHVGGSTTNFVKQMNRRATQLGMIDTRFASPNGLNDAGYSSAADLFTLTRAAMADGTFDEIIGTKFATIPSSKGKPRKIQNRNVLLWLYPGATGVKTGYTTKAGYCIVASAERDGRHLVAVVLGDPTPTFSDAAELLNYGFKGFRQERIVDQGEVVGTRTIGGARAELVASESLDAWVPRDGHVTTSIKLSGDQDDPTAVGTLEARVKSTEIGSVPLTAASEAVVSPSTPTKGSADLPRALRERIGAAAAAALLGLIGMDEAA